MQWFERVRGAFEARQRLREALLKASVSGAVPSWRELREVCIAAGVPGSIRAAPAGVSTARKEWGEPDAPEWLSVLEYLIERNNRVAEMKPSPVRSAEMIEAWRRAVRVWIEPHLVWIQEAQAVRAAVYAAVDAEQRAEQEAQAERERLDAELVAAERAARVAERALRRSRKQRAEYEAKRAVGEFLGYVEMKPGFFFGATARHRPRWTYVLLGEDGALYCGSTFYLRKRLREHRDGAGSTVTAWKPQRWFLLHAERHASGQLANCVEAALLGSDVLQAALLARCVNRAARLQRRYGCAVPWMGWECRLVAGAPAHAA